MQACGGHGYLEASGLPELHNTYLANCTLEGDNYMISQQTTRHLLKCLQRAREGSPVGGGESNPTISDSNLLWRQRKTQTEHCVHKGS